jgi:alpha-L-fucosidase
VAANGEALYGQVDRADRGRMEWMPTGEWTVKGDTAYYWCTRWPGEQLAIGGLRTRVEKASILATGAPVAFEQSENRLILKGLPQDNPDPIAGITVLKLECAGPPQQVLGAGYVVLE